MASQDPRDQSVTPPVYEPTPLGLAEILRDHDTTQNRQPLIARPSDLSAEEKAIAMDILQKWCNRQAGGVQPLTLTDTSKYVGGDPIDPNTNRSLTRTHIQIGTVSTRVFNKRRSQRDESERTISWEYRTTKSKYINPNYIDWSAFGGDRAMAHGACIANYDGHKLAALDAYNREYIVRRTTPEDIESWCHRSFINGRVAAQVMTIRN
ncbi:hypothetical protein CDV36_010738 [Fusarium kuroshium]|uniref:Uncharacterized protein n=1 Tax=Fusarium kuroshium TaxID=2010991 RepID=A0A3M2RWH4_9HYPO|nr:hypothetical protein CDV36_010738 [Fusarium kuroshium]